MKTFFQKIFHAIKTHLFLTIVFLVSAILVVTFSLLGSLYFNRFSKGIVPTDEDIKYLIDNNLVYDHVVIFGVDGAGGYFNQMETPGFDKVFNGKLDSSVTYTALAQFPTDSSQNWGSMFHGVMCGKHGLKNGNVDDHPYTDTTYPSFMKVYAESDNREKSMYSICHWSSVNTGIIENMDPQLIKINISDKISGNLTSEEVSEEVAKEAVSVIEAEDPTIIYMHFDCVDAAGHGYGYGKPEFISAMNRIDKCIDMVYSACINKGWEDNTLFVCIADHGHMKDGGHGNNNKTVREVTFAVAGGKGNIIKGTPGHVVVQDLASVVTYALGLTQPSTWDSKVPYNMFKNLKK